MINVSNIFKEKLQDGEQVLEIVEITFPDGTTKTLENEIMIGSNDFSDCAESSSFPVGATVCKTMNLELDNTEDQWKDYNFYQAKVHAYLKLQTSVAESASESIWMNDFYEPILDTEGNGIVLSRAASEDRYETIDKGVYTITTPEQYGEILSFTALDDMYKTNAKYYSALTLPQTVMALVRDACESLNIPMGFSSMSHGNVVVTTIPDNMTFRQLIGWAAMLETANARIDNRGYLQFVKWNFGAVENGSLVPTKLEDYVNSPTLSSDDIVITGIRVKNKESESLFGTAGYVLELENNLLSDSDLGTVAAWIGGNLVGAKFRNLQGDLIYNPLLEFGDMAYTFDRNGNKYLTPITDVSSPLNGITTVKTQADDPIRNSSAYMSAATKALVEARQLVKDERTEREKAVERLNNTLKTSGGLYMTVEPQDDGSNIYYAHNKPTLEESDIVWKFTAEAIGISMDGGKTYPYGFNINGELIARLLYAEGINASYINSGALVVRDSSGKIMFSADIDQHQIIMDGSSIRIGASPLDGLLSDMQGQIDGNINTWTGSSVPTLNNYPANEWLDDTEMSKHVGDIYYDGNSHAYRFVNEGNGYYWKQLKDTDVTKALQDSEDALAAAKQAQEAAALAKNMTLQLSNEYQGISVDSDGNYGTFPSNVSTQAVVMYGTQDITSDCKFTIVKSDSVTGSWNNSTKTYTVTALSSDSGWVDIKATYISVLSVVKRFSLAKIYAGKKGKDGVDGLQGPKGDQGIPGVSPSIRYASMPNGEDMTDNPQYVLWLDSDGNVICDTDGNAICISLEEIPYVGFLKSGAEAGSNNPSDYTWSRYQGSNGLSQRTHLAYANSADGKTDFSVSDSNREYIGMYVDFAEQDSTNPDDYAWTLVKGANGAQGIPGKAGSDGKTPYFHVAYANSADGKTGFDVVVSAGKQYIGQYTDYTPDDSTDPTKYSWTKIKGDKGDQGVPGRTYFLRSNATMLLMGQNKNVTPETLAINSYYRDGKDEEQALQSYWKVETSNDSGKNWVITDTVGNTSTNVLNIPSSVALTLGGHGMIRVTSYLDESKTQIADVQTYSIAVDVAALTHEQIFDLLTNDGAIKGIYKEGNQLYISFNYAKGGTLKLGGPNNEWGILKVLNSSGKWASTLQPDGLIMIRDYVSDSNYKYSQFQPTGISVGHVSATGNEVEGFPIVLNEDGTADVDAYEITGYAKNGNLAYIIEGGDTNDSGKANFYIPAYFSRSSIFTSAPKLRNLSHVSSGGHIVFAADGETLAYSSSSSLRYKVMGKSLKEDELEDLYRIKVIWAKYKDEYLSEEDERYGKEMPMFIAEDIDRRFPIAVDHDEKGRAENWNYRIMIPCMFAMLKNEHEKVKNLQSELDSVKAELNELKQLIKQHISMEV